MHFWWVNHKQTYLAEIVGGYIWSPKHEKNGSRSQFYLNMTLVEVGDLIFSYSDTKIKAIGLITNKFKESVKPAEFGDIGGNWSPIGWLVKVEWRLLTEPLIVKTHINDIREYLPEKYSPINSQGNGNQKCYLAKISSNLASKLIELCGEEATKVTSELLDIHVEYVANEQESKLRESGLDATEKDQLIKARLGQGLFRLRVTKLEKFCRVTRVTELSLLIASHIKPWHKCSNQERLDGNNGILLSPHIDKLFDKGWISFSNDGDILVYSDGIRQVLIAWGVNPEFKVAPFAIKQHKYLDYHRTKIFKQSSTKAELFSQLQRRPYLV